MASFDFASFLAHPSSSSVLPAAPAPISAEHQEKLDELIRLYGADDYVLASDPASGVEGGPLSDWEKTFLSREGLLRFLRADRFDVPTCIKRIDKCLTWRRKTGVDDLEGLGDKVEGEHRAKGGQFLFGYDRTGRPVIFMQPSRRDEPPSELGLIHLFWTLERAIDLMPRHVEKAAFLIDFSGKRKHSTPIGLAKEWVTVLQTCYPERLGLGILSNTPYLLSTFLSLVLRFADPLTQSKIIITSSGPTSSTLIGGTIAPDQLSVDYGGEVDLGGWDEGVHERYWGAVREVCAGRRGERLRCWKEVGGGVGVSEELWKGSDGAPE